MWLNRFSILFILLAVLLGPVWSQTTTEKRLPHLVRGKVVDGDTIPFVSLPEVRVTGKWTNKYKRDRAKYDRLVHNIKRTLPYARIAGQKLRDINNHLATLKSDKERKAYLKKAEKELFAEFEAPLKKLTFSQGRLLIKLIDRETGNTSYALVKEYRGNVSAFFWQSVARIFGANLKDEYDLEGNDKLIEQIIYDIDQGLL